MPAQKIAQDVQQIEFIRVREAAHAVQARREPGLDVLDQGRVGKIGKIGVDAAQQRGARL